MDLICADVLNWAASYQGEKFHALICDPPYELGFMGKDWDRSGIAFDPDTWAALAEHLHPGAFGMAFASARGWHRLAVAIEDAGLRIHPSVFCLGFLYGSGFPKATRIDTQIDKAAGAEREVIQARWAGRRIEGFGPDNGDSCYGQYGIGDETTAPATPLAQAWEGHRYGLQAMKPALEPIIVFQKPYEGKPVECITETGAGALWIDGGRIETSGIDAQRHLTEWNRKQSPAAENSVAMGRGLKAIDLREYAAQGRWPANFCLVHHPECDGDCHPDCPVRKLGEQSGESRSTVRISEDVDEQRVTWSLGRVGTTPRGHNDTGTAARFFYQAAWNLENADPVLYCAKASRKERDAGLEGMPEGFWSDGRQKTADHPKQRAKTARRNPHPTVKPLDLTRWLATLLLPPEEYAPRRLLVPFAGVGSEMIGAGLAGWENVLGIELSEENVEIGEARLAHWLEKPRQLELTERWT